MWIASLFDSLLLNVGVIRESTKYFNGLLTYMDLLVMIIRPIMPYTVTFIFDMLWNWFIILLIFVFIGLVKRFIPFYGNSKTRI